MRETVCCFFFSCSFLIYFQQVFTERQNILINLSKPLQCSCFRTSIWDETLYKVEIFPSIEIYFLLQAWSQIVYQLVPNVKGLEKTLTNFADIIDADEILLFEKATFLVKSTREKRNQIDSFQFYRLFHIVPVNLIEIIDDLKRSVISSNSLNYHAGKKTKIVVLTLISFYFQ